MTYKQHNVSTVVCLTGEDGWWVVEEGVGGEEEQVGAVGP